MICPLEIASDLSALRAARVADHGKHGWLLEGRDGAGDVFMRGNGHRLSAEWLPGRMRELSLEFDYSIINGPTAWISGDAALLGHFSDGVILVLKANSTRRIAAQKIRHMLRAANAALLGVVLDQRRFPIPTGIYKQAVRKSASFERGF